jgi:hypothetical protein
MWLPETAVDIETLEISRKQHKIHYTCSSPSSKIRKIGEINWIDVRKNS